MNVRVRVINRSGTMSIRPLIVLCLSVPLVVVTSWWQKYDYCSWMVHSALPSDPDA